MKLIFSVVLILCVVVAVDAGFRKGKLNVPKNVLCNECFLPSLTKPSFNKRSDV